EAGLPVLPRVDALAEDDEDLGVDRVDHAGERAAEPLSRGAVDGLGRGVPGVGGLPQARDRAARADHAALEGLAHEGVLTDVRPEAAARAAAAQRAVHREGHVADLARAARRAPVQRAVDHDPAADAATDRDHEVGAVVAALAVE